MTTRPLVLAVSSLLALFVACSDDPDEPGQNADASSDAKKDQSTDATDSGDDEDAAVEEKDSGAKDSGAADTQSCNAKADCQAVAECCIGNTMAGTDKKCTGATPIFCCIKDGYKTTNGGGACCSGKAKYNGSELDCSP